MMHEEEEQGLVNDDAPLRNLRSPQKRKRYLIALCAFVAFFILLASAIYLDKSRSSNSLDDVPSSASIAGDTGESDDSENSGDLGDEAVSNTETDDESLDLMGVYEVDEDEALSIEYYAKKCSGLREARDNGTLVAGTLAYRLAAANCGWGYDYYNSTAKNTPWKVVLFGAWSLADVDLSGCPLHTKCPLSPRCQIVRTTDLKQLSNANVGIWIQHDANNMVNYVSYGSKSRYNILHYREAHMTKVSLNTQKRFHFEMGVHYFSELINPAFLKTPAQLLSSALEPLPPIPFIPLKERPNFAMSAISDCNAGSQRDRYIDMIAKTVGKDRVHRYGKCGNREMPPKPINNAAKLIAKYKFYFSFENTIQTGYVTEKLFWVLTLPVLPVYYGTPDAPNITTIPSYIRASDFQSPSALAKYLLYLEANEEEYMKYHAWRKDPSLFTDEYLNTLTYKIAGPEEQLQYPRNEFRRFPRSAQCCRLCDSNFVEWAAKQRANDQRKPLAHFWSTGEVNRRFFDGKK